MADVNSNSTSESGCISSGLPLKVMRIAMENKGIFNGARPGALYCFTGEMRDVEVPTENGNVTYSVPVTMMVNGPEELKSFDGSGPTYGIQFTIDQNGKIIKATLASISNN